MNSYRQGSSRVKKEWEGGGAKYGQGRKWGEGVSKNELNIMQKYM